MAEQVRTIWGNFDFKDGIVVHKLPERFTGLPLGRQNHQAAVIRSQSDFSSRAEHPSGFYFPHDGLFDLKSSRQDSTRKCTWNLVSHLVVFGSAYYLPELRFPGVNPGHAESVSVRVWFARDYLGDNNQIRGHTFFYDSLYLYTGKGQDVIKFAVAEIGDIQMRVEPFFRD